jgi:hypothetical protein
MKFKEYTELTEAVETIVEFNWPWSKKEKEVDPDEEDDAATEKALKRIELSKASKEVLDRKKLKIIVFNVIKNNHELALKIQEALPQIKDKKEKQLVAKILYLFHAFKGKHKHFKELEKHKDQDIKVGAKRAKIVLNNLIDADKKSGENDDFDKEQDLGGDEGIRVIK